MKSKLMSVMVLFSLEIYAAERLEVESSTQKDKPQSRCITAQCCCVSTMLAGLSTSFFGVLALTKCCTVFPVKAAYSAFTGAGFSGGLMAGASCCGDDDYPTFCYKSRRT